MHCSSVFFYLSLLGAYAVLGQTLGIAEFDEKAKALLEAIAEVRNSSDVGQMNLQRITETSRGELKRQIRYKQKDRRIQTNHSIFRDGKLEQEIRILKIGDDLYSFEVGHNQVKLFSAKSAVDNSQAYLVFPGKLGITPEIHHGGTVRGCLRLESMIAPLIEEENQINDEKVTTVRYDEEDAVTKIRIDEKRLQVVSYESIYGSDGQSAVTKIENEYGSHPYLPTRSRSVEHYIDGRIKTATWEMEYLELPKDQSDLTLIDLDLPYGIMCTDDRLQRIIGYWNGKEFVERLLEEIPDETSNRDYTALVNALTSVFVLVLIGTVIFLFSKRST